VGIKEGIVDKPPKQPTYVTVIIWVIVAILALAILAWIYQFYKQNIAGNGSTSPTPTPSAVGPLNIKSTPTSTIPATTNGSWTLSMTDTTVSSSPDTSLNGTDSGQASFTMPSAGTFTAVGDWSGHSSGTSGPSTVDGTVSGKMTIAGQVTSGKLHYTVTYSYTQCATTIVNALGTNTDNSCPTTPPAAHSIDINITNGATASYAITSAAVTGTEHWTLSQK
jgi:hypothetical protein